MNKYTDESGLHGEKNTVDIMKTTIQNLNIKLAYVISKP